MGNLSDLHKYYRVSDADAVAADLAYGKTAYGASGKLRGSLKGGLNSLGAMYELEEATGNREDSTNGFKHLNSSTGSFAQTTGKVGNALDLASASVVYRNMTGDTAFHVSKGAGDISVWAWVNVDAFTDTAPAFFWVGGNVGTPSGMSWQLGFNSSDQPTFTVWNGSTAYVAAATEFGACSTGTWYFLCGRYDATTQDLGISVNGGAFQAITTVPTVNDPAYTYYVVVGHDTSGYYFDGKVDQPAFMMYSILDEDVAWLYNSGNGRTWAEF